MYLWSGGGPTILANAQPLCHGHNQSKGAMRPPYWYVLSLEHRRRRYFAPGAEVHVSGRVTTGELAQHTVAPRRTVKR